MGIGFAVERFRAEGFGGSVEARDRGTGLLGGEVGAAMNAGRIGSLSGGGVGGNMLRWTGGSDCCLDRLYRFGLTMWEAP